MDLTRRDIALAGLLAPFLVQQARAQSPAGVEPAQAASPVAAPASPGHDMSGMPAHWMGSEKVAFLIYPQFTALDMVGPHYMFTSLMGATTHVVAKTKEPVASDTGLVFVPSATFETCPDDLDILCVPGGGPGTLAAMKDEATLRFLKDRGARAKYVTSVCTGSLLLGAAGLLNGYKATSHWTTLSLLPQFGAIPVNERVVRDRNRITGAGVTAGIDMGLTLIASLRDRTYAEGVQLLAEYAPAPPFDAGTPDRAPPEVKALIGGMMSELIVEMSEAGRTAFAKFGAP